jgi:hypothetical protein
LGRSFRYYGKKRGNRRTGSPLLASMGEAVFSGILLLLGFGGILWMLGDYVIPEWRANHQFVETTCQVAGKRIGEHDFGKDGILFRPEIKIQYDIGGVEYHGWHYDIWYDNDPRKSYTHSREDAQKILDGFDLYTPGHKTNLCWYDPADPGIVVLARSYSLVQWLVFTVPLSFLIIGVGGLIHALLHWGKSAERQAVITQRAGERERDFFGTGEGRYPTVPRGVNMTNSPGTKLQFRLPMATSPGWALFGTLAFCILWNGIVAVLVTIAISGHISGTHDWFLTLLTIPFAAIGIGAIVVLVRQLLVTTGIGPTLVEISDHPLLPGGRYRVFVSQSGWLTVRTFRVMLVCEEIAMYRQGTDARTETREVHREQLFRQANFEIRGGMPFECEVDLNVHGGAMHSFAAAHNEIAWKIVVEGDPTGWPPFKRAFPVIICPPTGDSNR